jgi:hypothetical protein
MSDEMRWSEGATGVWLYQWERDADTGARYFYLPGHPRSFRCVKRTVDLGEGLSLDYDRNGRLIGIEHLVPTPLPETEPHLGAER